MEQAALSRAPESSLHYKLRNLQSWRCEVIQSPRSPTGPTGVYQQGLAGHVLSPQAPLELQGPHDHQAGTGVEAVGQQAEVAEVGAALPGALREVVAEEAVSEGVSPQAATVLASLLDMAKSDIGQSWAGVAGFWCLASCRGWCGACCQRQW